MNKGGYLYLLSSLFLLSKTPLNQVCSSGPSASAKGKVSHFMTGDERTERLCDLSSYSLLWRPVLELGKEVVDGMDKRLPCFCEEVVLSFCTTTKRISFVGVKILFVSESLE